MCSEPFLLGQSLFNIVMVHAIVPEIQAILMKFQGVEKFPSVTRFNLTPRAFPHVKLSFFPHAPEISKKLGKNTDQ